MNSSNIQQISPEHPQTNVPMATLAIMLSTAVVIMDINIAGIALPAMQGSLSANQDQISWVMTTYFMAQGVTMAATGWLAGRFGRKRLYVGALIGFAFCSVMAGNSSTLEEIIIWRGLQGMFSAPCGTNLTSVDSRSLSKGKTQFCSCPLGLRCDGGAGLRSGAWRYYYRRI